MLGDCAGSGVRKKTNSRTYTIDAQLKSSLLLSSFSDLEPKIGLPCLDLAN